MLRTSGRREVAFLLLIGAVGFFVAVRFDLAERFHSWARAHEDYDVDEIVMFVLAFALALSVLSWRRYRAGVVEARKLLATQRALQTSQAEAEHANQAKSLFLANVSHELRTPLTSLIGTNELLHETELNPQQFQFVEIMDRAGQRLLALVTDILDFSKLEAGTLRLRKVPLNLGILTYDVVALMRPLAQAKGLPIEHRLVCEPEVPDTLVGDPERIAQVLTTLLDNAIKFSASGVIRLTTSVSSEAPESALVVFAVSDEGIGIPEESHSRLFEAFSQLDTSMTRSHNGTGLGLAICADLVQMMDGSIKVESTPGEGSTFTVELPLAASSAPPVRLDGGAPHPLTTVDLGTDEGTPAMETMPAGWYRSSGDHTAHRYWNGASWAP